MEALTLDQRLATIAPPKVAYKMDPKLELGECMIRVRDLDLMLNFYQKKLNFKEIKRCDIDDGFEQVELASPTTLGDVALGNSALLILKHDTSAKERSKNSAGLHHIAYRVPDYKSLASSYLALEREGIDIIKASEHMSTKSIYFTDPEGNDLEVYSDTPRANWKRDANGLLLITNDPLDIDALLEEMDEEERADAPIFPHGTSTGHVHLRGTNLAKSFEFYKNVFGLDLTYGMTGGYHTANAAFLSAAGYHHHIAVNTWLSKDGTRLVPGSRGLEYLTMIVSDRKYIDLIRANLEDPEYADQGSNQLMLGDPDGIGILVRVR